MSESESETPVEGISDDQLPEDLQPGEGNPLAEPLDDDVEVEELDMAGGKTPEEAPEDSDSEDSDSEDSEDSEDD